jgi:beta-mannosidase
MYPAHARFQALVRAEAEANVKRLRHHPSIVVWCGNNEDYQIAQSLKVYDSTKPRDFRFPARAIYEGVLPEVCKTLDPTRPYWPGSPYGGADVYDGTIGDRHTWEIWHGAKADYRAYPNFSGRFVSEFGMQAAPSLPTIEYFTTEADRYPESRVMDLHNKAGEGPQRLNWYVTAELRAPATLEEYVYATQFIQAEAIGAAFDGWRRRWNGPGAYRTAGALVWQLNDCWPVTSWSLVDYFLRPKAAYYRARRSLAPISVGMAKTALGIEVWAVNMIPKAIEVVLDVRVMTLHGQMISQTNKNLVLTANRAVELETISPGGAEPTLVHVRLLKNQEEIAYNALWPDPVKHFSYPDPHITVQRINTDMIRIQSEKPARGVMLTTVAEVLLSDNYLDLMPGEPQIISGDGLGDMALNVWSAAGKATLK